MVRGLDIFKKYFEQYPDNYVIIGGTACDINIDEAGFVPRVTRDIDIILVVEALNIVVISNEVIDVIIPLNKQLWWVKFLIKILTVTFIWVTFNPTNNT